MGRGQGAGITQVWRVSVTRVGAGVGKTGEGMMPSVTHSGLVGVGWWAGAWAGQSHSLPVRETERSQLGLEHAGSGTCS